MFTSCWGKGEETTGSKSRGWPTKGWEVIWKREGMERVRVKRLPGTLNSHCCLELELQHRHNTNETKSDTGKTWLIQMKLKMILENTWVTYQRSWRRDPDHQRTPWTPHLDCGMCNWILGNLMNSLSWWTLGIKVSRVRGTRVTKRGKEV